MIDSLAMPGGGVSYEEYILKCLAPIQSQNVSKSLETEEESFEDATEEPSEATH